MGPYVPTWPIYHRGLLVNVLVCKAGLHANVPAYERAKVCHLFQLEVPG